MREECDSGNTGSPVGGGFAPTGNLRGSAWAGGVRNPAPLPRHHHRLGQRVRWILDLLVPWDYTNCWARHRPGQQDGFVDAQAIAAAVTESNIRLAMRPNEMTSRYRARPYVGRLRRQRPGEITPRPTLDGLPLMRSVGARTSPVQHVAAPSPTATSLACRGEQSSGESLGRFTTGVLENEVAAEAFEWESNLRHHTRTRVDETSSNRHRV